MNEILNNNTTKLTLEEQKKLCMTNVNSVDGFNEEIIKLTVNNRKVIIKGKNLKITQFNNANGNLTADGEFYQITYSGENVAFIKKIFK